MILHGRVVEQLIDRGEQGRFLKEILVTRGGALAAAAVSQVPVSMVRKRAVGPSGRAAATKAPVLLVHGFGQNRYAWHLPSRSLVNYLARGGYDVFNLDLRGHGRSRHLGGERAEGLYDYVYGDLPSAIEEVRALSGARKIFLVGHSLGGLVSYGVAPALEGAIAGVVSIGSPYHFARGSFTLGTLAHLSRIARLGRVPGLRNASLPINLVGSVLRRVRAVAESPLCPFPVRGWHSGAVEPHVLDDHLRLAFDWAGVGEMLNMFDWGSLGARTGAASRGEYSEAFERSPLPLLVVAGANDDLAPPESVQPAFARSRSRDKTYRLFPLGHIDLLMGSDAPLMTWPAVGSWLDTRAA